MNSENSFKNGIKDGIPIALGYLGVSFSFGIIAAGNGFPIWAAVLMSFTNLTSAGEFAGVNMIAADCALIELALTQFIINLRYSLMSLSLTQKIDESLTLPHRLITGYFITDEIFAVASSKSILIGRKYLYGLGLLPLIGWTLGTLIGAAAGSVLPVSVINALGIALYAMFVAIIIPPAKKQTSVRFVILISISLSCILKYTDVFKNISNGFVIILCTLLSAGAGAFFFPLKKEGEA